MFVDHASTLQREEDSITEVLFVEPVLVSRIVDGPELFVISPEQKL